MKSHQRARVITIGLAGVLASGSAEVGEPAARCSLVSPFSSRFAGSVYFTGTATGDTLAAGDSPTPLAETGGGHSAPAGPRRNTYYGQVVRAKRFVATEPDRSRLAATRATDEVVLVPWDYNAMCAPVPWGRSAAWVTSGTHGLFYARLRDTSRWVGGRPTFDVTAPQFMPYPSASRGRVPRPSAPDSAGELTADELLDLLNVMPPQGPGITMSPAEAEAGLQGWIRDHPHLIEKTPARDIIGGVYRSLETSRIRALDVPIAGTYRFVLSTPSGDSTVFHVRTAARPLTPLWNE